MICPAAYGAKTKINVEFARSLGYNNQGPIEGDIGLVEVMLHLDNAMSRLVEEEMDYAQFQKHSVNIVFIELFRNYDCAR